jgi:nucleotide-binding universal stress UspA family protein
VGVDDATGSEVLVGWAARMAARTGAELIVVTCWFPPDEDPGRAEHDRRLQGRRDRIDSLAHESVAALDVQARAEVFEDDPRLVLPQVAEAEAADLIVVGRLGAAGEEPGILHLGSVGEYLAHTVDRPLAVVPSDRASDPTRTVVVGADGSEGSSAAVEWCAQLAGLDETSAVAVNVEAPGTQASREGSPDDWLHYVEEQQLKEWVAPLEQAMGPVERVAVRHRRPADALLATARDRNADLIVIGSRGAGGFSHLRLGGTALRVLHRADLPAVLVPA